QLHGTAKSVADAFGGGAKLNADGTLKAPSYSIGGTQVGRAGDAMGNLDGRLADHDLAIAQLGEQVGGGTVGLVQAQKDAAGKKVEELSIGKTLGGSKLDITGTDGPRKLTGLANGSIASGSKDAVTGGQLHGTAQSVADALGGGARLNADGTLKAPSYSIG